MIIDPVERLAARIKWSKILGTTGGICSFVPYWEVEKSASVLAMQIETRRQLQAIAQAGQQRRPYISPIQRVIREYKILRRRGVTPVFMRQNDGSDEEKHRIHKDRYRRDKTKSGRSQFPGSKGY